MSVLAALAIVLSSVPQEAPQEVIELVSDVVSPAAFQPGEQASRVVSFLAPDGVLVDWPVALPYGPGAESAGAPRVARTLDADGRVRWTLDFPFTAWSPGDGVIGPFMLTVRGRGQDGGAAVGSAAYTVVQALPAGAAVPPAPAEPPFSPAPMRWELLPFLPLALAGLTGAGWWRARRSPASQTADGAPVAAMPAPDSIEMLDRAAELGVSDPGRAVLLLSEVARRLPLSIRAGVTPATTGSEASIKLEGEEPGEVLQAVTWAVVAADAWRFGGIVPDGARVADHASRLRTAMQS